jgi:hypothetical protein
VVYLFVNFYVGRIALGDFLIYTTHKKPIDRLTQPANYYLGYVGLHVGCVAVYIAFYKNMYTYVHTVCTLFVKNGLFILKI